MLLSHLLADVPATYAGDPSTPIQGVAYRSDRVRCGDVFFCVPGFVADGHEFAADAVDAGAAALVVERLLEGVGDVPQALVPDVRTALAFASAAVFGHPTRSLDVAGITGTNGKTTSAYLLDSVLRADGRRTGLIGTVETRIGERSIRAGRTTPESADLQELFSDMLADGCGAAVMEVSSHAIDLHRVDGMRFAVAAFTNLTQDHLDYHSTVEEYWSVKRRLFTELDVGERVVNIDDERGEALAVEVGGCLTVGTSPAADVRAEDVICGPVSSTFTLVCDAGRAPVLLPLAAGFNVSNALVTAGCALAMGVGIDAVVAGLEDAPQVPGRLERIEAGQDFAVLVDYAHTPDGLWKAISAVKSVTPGRVITVFGCGGDRDPGKRPMMGAAAAELSDVVVLTSDNPRSEDPVGIILQIEDGMGGAEHTVEVDRRTAIANALARAAPGDAVLVAGKGHEDYQQFADRTVHWDDREVVREELARLSGGEV